MVPVLTIFLHKVAKVRIPRNKLEDTRRETVGPHLRHGVFLFASAQHNCAFTC